MQFVKKEMERKWIKLNLIRKKKKERKTKNNNIFDDEKTKKKKKRLKKLEFELKSINQNIRDKGQKKHIKQ